MFPSLADPGFAPHNREQLAALGRRVSLEVLGGVPWLPSRLAGGPRPGKVALRETIDGVRVRHPRIAAIPGLPALSAALMAITAAPLAWWLARARRAEVLLAAEVYPDGVAAVALGRALGLPVVVKVHGPDLDAVEPHPLRRAQVHAALRRAERVVVVCSGLAERARALGVRENRIRVVLEGVDRGVFRPREARVARRHHGLPIERSLVLYASPLTEEAGLPVFLEAARRLGDKRPEITFVIAGEGPLERRLQDVAEAGGSQGRILPVGALRQADLAEYLAAADVVCVPGRRSGIPHVVREALASGRPVVAADTGCVDEVINNDVLGRLVPPGDAAELAVGLLEVLDEPPIEPATRVAAAYLPTWVDSAARLHAVLEEAAAAGRSRFKSM